MLCFAYSVSQASLGMEVGLSGSSVLPTPTPGEQLVLLFIIVLSLLLLLVLILVLMLVLLLVLITLTTAVMEVAAIETKWATTHRCRSN